MESRYKQIKKLDIQELAAFLSWYFYCDTCPARSDDCWDNDAMCMDALKDWLNEKGQI